MVFSLEKTRTTPKALFNKGYITIEGKSIPVENTEFYETLFNITVKYLSNPAPVTVVDLNFEYINAYSKKSMMQFFRILESIKMSGNKIFINWFYQEEDEAMLELGKIYENLLSIPFKFCTK